MKAGRWLAALGLVAALTACGSTSSDGDGLRRDSDPLVSLFPGLGDPVAATWVGWDNNSSRAAGPGPTTQWLDAVVELEPERADELRAVALDAGTPTVREALRPHLPSGPFLAGPELDAAIVGDPELATRWTVTGHLERTGNRLVLNGLKPA